MGFSGPGPGRTPRNLSEQVIRNAMKHTQSNFQASRYLNMTIATYRNYAKMYMDQESGKNLYELHKNGGGKGIKRISWKDGISVERINEIMSRESYTAIDLHRLKNRMIYEGILRMECYHCNHSEKRVIDFKQPLILNFIDGKKTNWQVDNLRMLCHNCYFLFVGDLYSEKQILRLEDATAPLLKKDQPNWQVDDDFLSYFNDISPTQPSNDYEEGDEYIAKL